MAKQLDHTDHQQLRRTKPLCYLAHNLHTPQNVGSLFRLADALGVEKIYLSGTSPTPPNSRIKKTARSTEKYVPHEYIESPFDAVQALKAAGHKIVSLELATNSVEVSEAPLVKGDKICLILGAEHEGVIEALLEASDFSVHIPMSGINSSMNVATACAIASYELLKKII